MVSVCAAIAAVLIVLCPAAAVRGDADTDAFVAHQAATQTFEADLHQTFHWTFPPRHVDSSGHIIYRAPNSLVIVLTNPVTELVLVRDNTLYVKRANRPLAQTPLEVRHGKPTQNVQFLLGFFQDGCTNFANLFDLRTTRKEGVHLATLLPRHPIQLLPLRSVDSTVAWPSMDVESMQIHLIFGGYLEYRFANVRRNQPVNENVFVVPHP